MEDTAPLMRRLELRPHQAVSVKAAPGTIVRCLEGTIWLTQEALLSDCILIAGTRFVSASNGKIVLNSLDGSGVARIYNQGRCGRHEYVGSGLQIDSGVIARIEGEARRERAREIGRWVRKLGALVASAWHALKGKAEGKPMVYSRLVGAVTRRKANGSTSVEKQSRAVAAH